MALLHIGLCLLIGLLVMANEAVGKEDGENKPIGEQKQNAASSLNIYVYEVSNCDNREDYAISYDDISMKLDPETKVTYINGFMNMSIPWDDQLVLKYVLKKCPSKDTDSCIEVLNKVFEDVCAHLGEENEPWTALISHLDHFKTKCPVSPGRYPIDLEPIETSSLESLVDPEALIWHIQCRGHLRDNPNKLVLCMDSAFEIKRKRRNGRRKKPADTSAVDDV